MYWLIKTGPLLNIFFNFQKKDGEWHEILVDIKEGGGLRFIMSRGPTTNSKAFLTVSYISWPLFNFILLQIL